MTTEPSDWKSRIVALVLVKQRLAEVDRRGLWPHRLPRVAAESSRIVAAEKELSASLDPSYRSFLEHADGWPAFFQKVDLLGTEDILNGSGFSDAMQALGYIDDAALNASGVSRDALLPIAHSRTEGDLFVLVRASSPSRGAVIWFGSGLEVERFPSFDEFFLAMIDYNRAEIEALQQRSN